MIDIPAERHMKRTHLIIVILLLVAAVAAGIAFDQHRAKQRQQPIVQKIERKVPPLPQWGALMPEADDVQVSGSAMCGYCTWRAGEPQDNMVLQMDHEPGIVFVVGNSKRAEIEKLTGACAGGDYYITARGAMTQYNGHNYLLVKNFEAVKTK